MKYTKEYLTELVNSSKSIWEVVEKTDLSKQSGNYNYINRLIKRLEIDKTHFTKQTVGHKKNLQPLSNYLVKGKFLTLNGNRLKQRLYEEGLKYRFCELCGQNEEWKGKKISLILDHKDGDRENNELSNLQIVCPNCNATLDTHCGKNRRNRGV